MSKTLIELDDQEVMRIEAILMDEDRDDALSGLNRLLGYGGRSTA
jgi:hypothetical protein